MKKNLPSTFFSTLTLCASKKLFMVVFAAVVNLAVNAQPFLLRDINQQEDIEQCEYRSLTPGAGKVYFINNFNELWKTTGNVAGTVRLKAFGQIDNLTHIGATLYFAADDGTGVELWKSTGTFSSTMKVKELVPGLAGGNPHSITEAGDIFYFVATTPEHGVELWKSDGTGGGTTMVKDIRRGQRSSEPKELTFSGGILYFTANDGINGFELWRSDGTSDGTFLVKDIRSGQYRGSDPAQLTSAGGAVYFSAYEPEAGRELWMTSGTTESTVRVADIRAGTGSADVGNLTAVGSILFFSANDGIHGHELWKADGTRASLVKDLTPGRNGSHSQRPFMHPIANFTSLFGLLYFTAYQGDTYYIWKSNGTATGTVPLEIAMHGIAHPEPKFVAMGTSIFYFNSTDSDNDYYGIDLRKMGADGSSRTSITSLEQQDYYSRYTPDLETLNNSLYFWGRSDEHGFKLFRSNGTPRHRVVINDSHMATVGSYPSGLVRGNNGQVFFSAEESPYHPSVWRTDGTSQGTIKIHEGDMYGSPRIVAASSTVYFSSVYGRSIWKTNGTPEGTVEFIAAPVGYVRDLATLGDILFMHLHDNGLWRSDGSGPGTFALTGAQNILWMKSAGNLLFYLVVQENHRFELWRTNGQPAETFKVLTFTEQAYTNYIEPVVHRNNLYFMADDGVSGNEIWRTDGTIAGTSRIADLNSGDTQLPLYYESDIAGMAMWQDELYISALDDSQTWGLFRSNGSQVTRLTDLEPVGQMMPADDRLHLMARVPGETYYYNHWVTDGSKTGTEKINDEAIYGGLGYTVHDGLLFFAGWNNEFWRSDGTACGTFRIDLGGVRVTPEIELLNGLLVFAGSTTTHGTEPYAYMLSSAPASPCSSSLALMSGITAGGEGPLLISYPNPFSYDFSVTVPATTTEMVEIQAFNISGLPVAKSRRLSSREEYRLGADWAPGSYILRVRSAGVIKTYQVLKE